MRLVTLRTDQGTRAALVEGDEVVELDASDVGSLLARDPGWRSAIGDGRGGRRRPLSAVSLAPIVPAPRKIICLGHNYLTHIREMGAEPPQYPTLFAKFARALIGPNDDIILPEGSTMMDWEAELAIVLGQEARHVTDSDAAAAIAGYTIANDVTARDWQRRTKQWLQGKTVESTTPVGPALVTPDEVDHAADLEVRCEVDGTVMQRARTSDLLFRPPDIVSYVSGIITLEPGDLILTGTPSGVGAARTPPVYLRPGQVVRTAIEGLGQLVNRCVSASLPPTETPVASVPVGGGDR